MKIIIAGAGGHGKVVCDALLSAGVPHEDMLGFVDDDPCLGGGSVMGFRVLGSVEALRLYEPVRVALGIGSNAVRRRKFEQILALGYEPLTVVHPTAVIGRGCVLGRGVVVFANVVVNCDSHVGDNSILNTGCSVDHDCRVNAHAHVAPGARLAGGVTVGEEALIGIGFAVMPGLTVGARSIVGAGGVLVRGIDADCVAVGVPARVVRHRGEPTRE